MPLTPYVTEGVFDPPAIAMTAAYEAACASLGLVDKGDPLILPEDVKRFSALVRKRGLSEDEKPDGYARIAGRITLFHDVIERGLSSFEKEET